MTGGVKGGSAPESILDIPPPIGHPPPMQCVSGIPIGPLVIRGVRKQRGQTLINVPADIARSLHLATGSYVVMQRWTDGTLRVQRFTPEVVPRGHVSDQA